MESHYRQEYASPPIEVQSFAESLKSPHMPRVFQIEPALGWTYLSRDALARAKAQMDGESMGVRDEIGFLAIHQRYADRFFPGTSVLHTRARYALFVPWLFKDLTGLMGPAATREMRERERVLAGRLSDAGETQVIGGRVFPKPSSQPPSTVYWNALRAWGILRDGSDGRAISRAQAHRSLLNPGTVTDDDGAPLVGMAPPFVALPDLPDSWHSGPITFKLTSAEAVFLRERLGQLRREGDNELSLLARLVRTEAVAPVEMWADDAQAIAGPDQAPLVRAQQAASLAGVGRAIYNALLESNCEADDKRKTSTRHREHLATVVEAHMPIAITLNLDALEADIGALPSQLRAVLMETKNWLNSPMSDPDSLRAVFTAAESRKGTRARLPQTLNGRARRLEWSLDEHSLAAPLHYRWSQVSTLLKDLADAE